MNLTKFALYMKNNLDYSKCWSIGNIILQAQTLDRGEMEELVQQAEEEEEEEEEEEDEELEEEIKVSRKKNKKKAKKQRVCKSIFLINAHQCLAAIIGLDLSFLFFFFARGGGGAGENII